MENVNWECVTEGLDCPTDFCHYTMNVLHLVTYTSIDIGLSVQFNNGHMEINLKDNKTMVVFTLFCLNRCAMPPVRDLTAPLFCSINLSRFNFRLSTARQI